MSALLSALQAFCRGLLAPLQKLMRAGFVPASLNPMQHLGALTIFFFWIVLVSGIWLFIFFRTSVDGAYESVEALTHSQWLFGGVMRSLHRYASDAAVVTLVLHIVSEFAADRYRGKRWFSWVTGLPLLWLVIPLGITGYWLVWDQLAQYVALTTAELIDWLPIFTDSMARNFLSDEALSNRFFTLMAFLHIIGLPLFLVFGIWLHVFRINGARVNPPRLLMAGSLLAMLVLSLTFPALSQGPAELDKVPASLGLDWFYLLVYPLMKSWSPGWVWALLAGVSALLLLAPWLPPQPPRRPVQVDLDNCNGCERCVADCPFGAVAMAPRSDGKAYLAEAVVDPDLCISCGICVGACPTATPFRSRSALIPGIDLPDHGMADLRERLTTATEKLQGVRRVVVFGCDGSSGLDALKDDETAVVGLVCMAQLPPSFIDFVLSRGLADGVYMAGCGDGICQYRLGMDWTEQRTGRERDPHLRKRVDGQRVALGWQAEWAQFGSAARALKAFRDGLAVRSPAVATRQWARWPAQALAYGLFALTVGLFSVWPAFSLLEPDQAMVSITFSHSGQRVQACRTLTQEELQKLPPNMRKPTDCPRERHPLDIELLVNQQPAWRTHLPATGIWQDGQTTVYHRITLSAGTHELLIRMRDGGPDAGFDYTGQQHVVLAAAQNLVIEFDQSSQSFVFR